MLAEPQNRGPTVSPAWERPPLGHIHVRVNTGLCQICDKMGLFFLLLLISALLIASSLASLTSFPSKYEDVHGCIREGVFCAWVSAGCCYEWVRARARARARASVCAGGRVGVSV